MVDEIEMCIDLKVMQMVVFFLVHYISFISFTCLYAFETKLHLCFFTEICLNLLY